VNKHQPYDLKQLQSLPLESKILMTQRRIKQWYDHWEGQVYVSFSGGKDSTVLKHIVDNTPGVYDVPAVFVNTGLEYPEIQRFVLDVKAGKWDCFNPDVEILRPEMRFDEVLKKYGYPVVSKSVSHAVKIAKRNPDGAVMKNMFDPENKGRFGCYKWKFLIDAEIPVSDDCCNIMKKAPAKKYAKSTGRKPILGTLAEESNLRYKSWLQNGCNAFNSKNPTSQPLSFWTNQDILHYIKRYNVPYCPVYGDIVVSQDHVENDQYGRQINLIDYLGCYEPEDKLETTGCDRTGCIFCMFGCHLEKSPNRFQRLKETHPRQYEYCIGGGEMVDGKWQPSKEGLGLGKVLDYIGVKY
jgi:3'-phosphoadenosine 5'-phosphosulfate sulfotransferase (PAPS reductase)/FAD synthetase